MLAYKYSVISLVLNYRYIIVLNQISRKWLRKQTEKAYVNLSKTMKKEDISKFHG